ncbi:MAG: McrC family protein [Pseudomonadota bacterium]|nr:McrC family protein [Pseudomonadota bacterium]
MNHLAAPYYCLFEHQRVSAVAIAGWSDIQVLPAWTFAWLLEQLESSRNCFVLEAVRGVPVIKFQQCVGVLRCPDGVVLEILPKAFKHDDTPEAARAILLKMLAAVPEITALLQTKATVQLAKMPLLDVFLQLALDSFAQVIQRGLRRDYRTEQGNLPTLRGRLLVSQQLRHNLTNQAQFFTAHDEYTAIRAENRLLKSALLMASRIAKSTKQQHLAHELLLRIGDVPASQQLAQDWRAVRLDRNMSYYRPALAWAKILLDQHSPLVNAGQQEALSLWFDMNQLFERYVLVCLNQNLPKGHQILAQSREKAMLHLQSTQKLEQHGTLKPDLLYQIDGQAQQVLDTKWKLINTPNPIQSVSPADLYQMQAYAAAYLPHGGQVCLIYPKTAQFQQPITGWRFSHIQDGSVELRLLPFCLVSGRLGLIADKDCG